jgi:hypothetical protein
MQEINAHTTEVVNSVERQELATGEISINVVSAASESKVVVAALSDVASGVKQTRSSAETVLNASEEVMTATEKTAWQSRRFPQNRCRLAGAGPVRFVSMSYSPSTRRHFDRAFGQLITSTASLSATSKARRRAVFAPGGQADERLFPNLGKCSIGGFGNQKGLSNPSSVDLRQRHQVSALMESPAASARRP